MRDVHPLWYEGFGATAHLIQPGYSNHLTAWCGADVSSVLAPYRKRCKTCLNAIARYTTEATVEPPARVRTQIVMTIEHNADVSAVELLQTAERRVLGSSSNPNWTLVASTAYDPEPVVQP